MENNLRFSIVVPIYNVEKFLDQCITSAGELTGVTITSATDIPTLATETLVAWFSKDTKTIKVGTCAVQTNAKLYKCTGAADISDENAKGNYTLDIKKNDGNAPTDTFTISGVKTLCYTKTACWTILEPAGLLLLLLQRPPKSQSKMKKKEISQLLLMKPSKLHLKFKLLERK